MEANCLDFEEPPGTGLLTLAAFQNWAPDSLKQNISIQTVTDINICKDLFEAFSPKDSLFSTWDFRYAWYQKDITIPLFFLLSRNNQPVALLPLWYDRGKNRFEWFGSDWQENNTFWTLDKKLIPLMTSLAPSRTLLNTIRINDPQIIKMLCLVPDDPKFELDLSSISSVDDFLARLPKKKRYNLRRDRQRIRDAGVEIIKNRFEDIENLIRYANCRFSSESLWTPSIIKAFTSFAKNASFEFKMEMLTFKIGQSFAGYDLNFIYRDIYYGVKCGYDVETFPGIGNFATLYDIDMALQKGCRKIDFLQSVGALTTRPWKADWFTTIPLYKFEKGL